MQVRGFRIAAPQRMEGKQCFAGGGCTISLTTEFVRIAATRAKRGSCQAEKNRRGLSKRGRAFLRWELVHIRAHYSE